MLKRPFAVLVLLLWGPRSALAVPCADMDDAHLYEAVTKARILARSCLIDGGLNPALGKRIESPTKAIDPTFHCAYKIDDQAVTSWQKDHPEISVDMDKARPKDNTSVPELRPIDLTLFHELVHAAGDGDTMRASRYSHNQALGFPDGIYGCEFACGGEIDSSTYGHVYLMLYEAIVAPLTPDPKFACPPGYPDGCDPLKKFAALCRNGAPKLSSDEKLGLRLFENALCVKENSADLKDGWSQGLRDAGAAADKAGGSADEKRLKLMTGYLKELIRIVRHGTLGERIGTVNFFSAHSCPDLAAE